jgi:hypothetical protein
MVLHSTTPAPPSTKSRTSRGHLDARDELLTKIAEEFGFNPASVIDDAPAE